MTGIASMLSDAVPAVRKRSTPIHSTNPKPELSAPVHSSNPTYVTLQFVSGSGRRSGMRESGRTPSSICHAMKLSMSKARARWKYFIATVPAAQPNPERTAQPLDSMSPCQCHGSTTSVSPTSARAIASHCMPRTRSPSTGQARSTVQNGIVNTRTAARPAPPPATAIVVEPMLTAVWKKPVTATATHDSGSRRPPQDHQRDEQRGDGDPRALDVEDHRMGARERELHRDPVGAPQDGQHHERDVGAALRAHGNVRANHRRCAFARNASIAAATAAG